MIPGQSLFDATMFRLMNLTWLEVLDLLLVTLAFYLLLRFVQHSRAAFLLRGMLVLTGILFIITIFLPIPAFGWLIRAILIAVLIATPIIFQPELRQLLERIGRSPRMARYVRRTAVEQVLARLVRAVENMSVNHTGALIVLEGNTSLQDVVETGVTINGRVTSELLQAIFYPSNPLHDGAVILREDRVVAAGCALPLTQHSLVFRRRLGMRHRAAVGLSETSDALVVVVSEETGEISVAHSSTLQGPIDIASLRKHLFDYYGSSTPTVSTLSLWGLVSRTWQRFWQSLSLPTLRQLLSNAGLLVIALLLALATWTFVIQQTNPATRLRFENISLLVEDIPAGTTLVAPPPSTVAAVVETTDTVRPSLSSRSFQALVSLEGLPPGLHTVPVQVNSSMPQVLLVSVDPAVLDLQLAPIISRTMDVKVELADQQSLSRAYEVVGAPLASPAQVEVVGAKPLVDRVNQLQATISLANASTSLREMRPLRALDEAGREVTGVTLQPAQARVSVSIRRRINAQDVGVRIVTDGRPAPGYWVSGLNATPANVTLQGNPEQLAEIGSYVDTLPVDVNEAVGDISLQIPLDLPPDVQAVDSDGNTAKTVAVQVKVAPRRSNLSVTRPVELVGVPSRVTATVDPSTVDLILSGPLPTLNEIEADPELVRVTVDATVLDAGQRANLPLTVNAPEEIQVQIVPLSVEVTLP